ncbi:MAG TPA: integrase family protein [Acetobacteraceae bacterium]|nr:integrase family protein [Acetobacteraceae bacterium]
MQTKLTSALVRKVTETEAPQRDTSYFDIEVPRMALRVKPPRPGSARWSAWFFIRYTAPGGGERRMKVGDPRTMDLADARVAAKRMLAKVDGGGDPAADKARLRLDWTVREAWDAYASSREFGKHALRSQLEDKACATNHILHHVAATKLSAIDAPLVRRLHRLVEADRRTNKRKRRLGGPGAARRAARVLSSMLSWAVNEGQLDRNPIIGTIRLDGTGERTTILDRPEQYTKLFETMDKMVADGKLRSHVRAFVVVLAATGLRRNEARALRWGDLDLGARRVTLRDPKGAKLARGGPATETVSLPPIAAAALAAIRPEDAHPHEQVFVPVRGQMIAVNHDWRRIRAEAELPADLVLHGLRHSIGTAGIVAGMSTAEVGKMLRHRNVSVTQRYVHLAEATRSRLQDRAIEGLIPDKTPAAANDR